MPKPTAQQWINKGLENNYSFEDIRKKLLQEGQWDSSTAKELKTQFEIAPGVEKTPEQQREEQLTNYALNEQIINAKDKSNKLFKMATGISQEEAQKQGITDHSQLGTSEGIRDSTGTNFFGRSWFANKDKDELTGEIGSILKDKTFEKLSTLKLGGSSPGSNPSDADMKMIAGSISALQDLAITDDGDPNRIVGFRGSEENVKQKILEIKNSYDRTLNNLENQKKIISPNDKESEKNGYANFEEAKTDLIKKYEFAKANPDHPKAKSFLDAFENDKIDFKTGKLKAEFKEKSEAEKLVEEKLKASGLYETTALEEQPTTEGKGIQEKEEKGFFGNFGEDIQREKNIEGIVKSQEELGKKSEELSKKFQDLNSQIKNTTDPKEKEKLTAQKEELKKEMKANIKAIQDSVVKSEVEMAKIDERKAGDNKTFGSALYEGIQDVADLGRDTGENLKETGSELLDRGKGIVEAGGRLAKGEQGLGSTALQMAGEVGGGVGDVVELGGKQFIDTLKAGGKVLLPQGAEDYLGEKGKDEINNVIQSVANTEDGRKALGWFMEKGKEWDQFKTENPVEAKNIEAVGKITEGVLAMAGLSKAKKISGAVGSKLTQGAENLGEKSVSLGKKTGEILKGTGQKVGDVASGVNGKVKGVFKASEKSIPEGTILEGQKGAELLDKLKPKFTPTQNKKLVREGRIFKEEKGKIKGFLEGEGKDVYSYSQYDKDIANSVADTLGGVEKVEKMDKNEIVRNLRDRIKVTSETLKPELEKVSIDPKKIGNIKDEWKIIKQTQAQDPNFSSANGKKLHKDFETFIDKVGVIKGNKLQSADELWSLTKKYDDLYPNIANYVGDDPKRLLQKEMWNENRSILRNTINNAVENSNASKETKEAFKKMSHYYRAIDNIGTQTLEEGTEGVKSQIKESIKGKVVAGAVSLAGAGYLGSKF